MTRTRIAAFSAAILLVGCSLNLFSGDGEALDRFSHAYTEFLDTGEVTGGILENLGADRDPVGFWILFKGAFDPSSDDASRLAMAEAAIGTYDKYTPNVLDAAADEVEKLDNEVQRLFETANAIQNQDYRDTAVQVEKYAREAEASVALVQTLVDKRTRLQRQTLSDVVNANGSLVRAFNTPPVKLRVDEGIRISQELQDLAKNSTGCLASTTFTHQRQLFLPINDNYNLDELLMI